MIHRRLLCHAISFDRSLTAIPRRWSSTLHRERQKEERRVIHKAMGQLDDFYGSVFKEEWPSIRIALLCPKKRAILVNNFSDKERIVDQLKSEGLYSLREVFAQKKGSSKLTSRDDVHEITANVYQVDGRIEDVILRQQVVDLESIYPEPIDSEAVKTISQSLDCQIVQDQENNMNVSEKVTDPSKDKPLGESLKTADLDMSRLITPGSSGIAMSAALYDFIPTTKLKGMEDYVPESAHYNYYKEHEEVPIEVELEDEIEFPPLLDVYAFERGNCSTIKYSGKGSTNVLDYHIMDLGVLAPVVALDVRKGDFVLDMNSRLLDVTMLLSQTLIPAMFVANCESAKRASYLLKSLNSYIFNVEEDESNIIVTDTSPLMIEDFQKFDKIFVCVLSTDDRKAVNVDEDNLFNRTNLKRRINLPEEQKAHLKHALELVKDGGSVIYCTESLSPVQNDAVVQQAIEDLYNKTNSRFTVRDLSRCFEPWQQFMKITKSGKYGHYVVPFLPNNCGPLYFSKIVKSHSSLESESNKRSQTISS